MIFKNKQRFKPLYKNFLKLKENIQNRSKLLNFKKQKWEKLIQIYKKKQKRFFKYKPYDYDRYIVSKYPNKSTSYQKKYKITLQNNKKIRLFYGELSKNYLKHSIKKSFKENKEKKISIFTTFLIKFESRLDTVLYRSKFSYSIRNAQQLIVHGKILVNNKPIRIKSYKLLPGDIISIKPGYKKLIILNLKKSEIWPISPKYLIINYKTLQIAFLNPNNYNFSNSFNFNLNLEKVLTNFKRI